MVLYRYKKNFAPTDEHICTRYGIQSLVDPVDIIYPALNEEQKNMILISNNPEE